MGAPHSNPIVVGVDSSPSSSDAVRWAADEASRRALELTLVHAGYYLYEPALSQATASQAAREIDEHAHRLLSRAAETAAEVDPALQVRTVLDSGDPADVLVSLSESASMLVMGTETGGSIAGLILHSISQSVAAHAHCPVVVVNKHAPANAERKNVVVVGISPTAGGQQALRFAFEQARHRGCSILAVRSWGDIGSGSLAFTDAGMLDELQAADSKVMDECLARFEGDFGDVAVERRSVGARAQWALEEAAIGAELLVVGCHRCDEHWFSRLGPVASWLLHRSPCPVAVVGRPHASPAAPQSSDPGQAYRESSGAALPG